MSPRQGLFAQALLDPELVPEGLRGPTGAPAGKRFDVYRNNVTVSLIEALEAGFPAVRALVGEEFFAAMAREHLRAHLPRSPVLALYGQDLPAWLARFSPVAHLGYLPDVARLELMLRRAHHAADAAPADPSLLAALPPEALMATRLGLAPAVAVLRSPWPVVDIWRANLEGGPPPAATAQNALIARPGLAARPWALGPGGAAFVEALLAGQTFGAAVAAATAEAEGGSATFDLGATLSLLIEAEAITDISPPEGASPESRP